MISKIIGLVLMMPVFVICGYGAYLTIKKDGFGEFLSLVAYAATLISFAIGWIFLFK